MPLAEVQCYNCGRKGHYMKGCHFPSFCMSCEVEGHTSAQCPGKFLKPELVMYGFGMRQLGFYLLEGSVDVEEEVVPNAASVVVTDGEATVESLLTDLRDMLEDDDWYWHIKQVRRNRFAVVFPLKESLRLSKKSDTITLPISKHKTEVGEALVEPQPISWLKEAWIRVHGVPDKLRHVPLVKEFLRVMGKATVMSCLSSAPMA